MSRIWVNGCFDVLHIGHIRLFEYAKSLGDWLRVGIDSDYRVKSNKGENRPINSWDVRLEFLMSLKYIDDVVVFSSDDELRLSVKDYAPKYMVVGEEYKDREVIGHEYATNGVFYFKRVGDYSTSSVLGE